MAYLRAEVRTSAKSGTFRCATFSGGFFNGYIIFETNFSNDSISFVVWDYLGYLVGSNYAYCTEKVPPNRYFFFDFFQI